MNKDADIHKFSGWSTNEISTEVHRKLAGKFVMTFDHLLTIVILC